MACHISGMIFSRWVVLWHINLPNKFINQNIYNVSMDVFCCKNPKKYCNHGHKEFVGPAWHHILQCRSHHLSGRYLEWFFCTVQWSFTLFFQVDSCNPFCTFVTHHLPCSSILATPPPSVCDVQWFLAELEVSWQQSPVMGSYTHMQVGNEIGEL